MEKERLRKQEEQSPRVDPLIKQRVDDFHRKINAFVFHIRNNKSFQNLEEAEEEMARQQKKGMYSKRTQKKHDIKEIFENKIDRSLFHAGFANEQDMQFFYEKYMIEENYTQPFVTFKKEDNFDYEKEIERLKYY